MKCCLYVLLLISLVPKTGHAQSEDAKLIIGKWLSEDDKNYQVVFTQTTKLDYYSGKLEDSFDYKIKNDSLIATDKSNSRSVFYNSVESLTNKYLSLMYLGHGNMLIFRREASNK